MGWLSALITVNLIGVSSNFDNTGVGIAYGSDQIKFPHWVNAIINIVGGITAFIGGYLGDVISQFVGVKPAGWLACFALGGIGFFFWYASYIHPMISKSKSPIRIPTPGFRQSILLGLAMSLDNIVLGFGATVSNIASMWAESLSIAVLGYVMLWFGHRVGIGILSKFLGRYSAFIAGLILVMVGIYQIYLVL